MEALAEGRGVDLNGPDPAPAGSGQESAKLAVRTPRRPHALMAVQASRASRKVDKMALR